MIKRVVIYSMVLLALAAVALTVAGGVVKKRNIGRTAPGIVLCGRDISGMTLPDVEAVIEELVPETVAELHCRFLPEMREELEKQIQSKNKTGEGKNSKEVWSLQEKEICLTIVLPLLRVDVESTLRAVTEKSEEVKVWEWLYGAVARQPYKIRTVEASFMWEESVFRETVDMLRSVMEREQKDATVAWEKGTRKVTESRRGFRLNTDALWREAETAAQEATERLQVGPAEGLVLRFYITGTALMPGLTTAQAEKCNTVIGSFTTMYTGAGSGRAQNIETGAGKLHGTVVLPGETFSVATALMPFTESNGYATGGTYIDGQLSESIGGGVCQLSTTIYNALLQTKLEITERHPHSLPVGYVPLGQDAAIAGDYKDLKFKNTTDAPVLLLCETMGESVKVTLYGTKDAGRSAVSVESVTIEETKDSLTVEVYRTETVAGGGEKKERVSRDKYRRKDSSPVASCSDVQCCKFDKFLLLCRCKYT